MSNFEIVVYCFRYLLEDKDIEFEYIEKLHYDTKHILAQERILCRLRKDIESGEVMMYISSKEETHILYR